MKNIIIYYTRKYYNNNCEYYLTKPYSLNGTMSNCLKNNSCYYDWYIGLTSLFDFLIHSRLTENSGNRYAKKLNKNINSKLNKRRKRRKMEVSKYCEICKRPNCYIQVNDMQDIKPSCYAEVEMVEYEDCYVPKELCTTNRYDEIDDCIPCSEYCSGEGCDTCIVSKVFNDYARLTGQIKKIN